MINFQSKMMGFDSQKKKTPQRWVEQLMSQRGPDRIIYWLRVVVYEVVRLRNLIDNWNCMTVDNTFIVLHTLVQSVWQCGDLVATLHVLKEEPDFSCSFWCDTLNDIDRSLEPPQPRFLIDIIVKLPFLTGQKSQCVSPQLQQTHN